MQNAYAAIFFVPLIIILFMYMNILHFMYYVAVTLVSNKTQDVYIFSQLHIVPVCMLSMTVVPIPVYLSSFLWQPSGED